MTDLYNECERCGQTCAAPFQTERCLFEIGGWTRHVHLCSSCRKAIVPLIKTVLRLEENSRWAR